MKKFLLSFAAIASASEMAIATRGFRKFDAHLNADYIDGSSVVAGSTLISNSVVEIKTDYVSDVKDYEWGYNNADGDTVIFEKGFQTRIDSDPAYDSNYSTFVYTAKSSCTPLFVTVKKEATLAFYYRRQATSGSAGTFTMDDGKDSKLIDTSVSVVSGEEEVLYELEAGDYAYVKHSYTLSAGEYFFYSKGTTGCLAAIEYAGEFEESDVIDDEMLYTIPTTYTVYYNNAYTAWTSVYCYTWNESTQMTGAWPGTEMTLDETTSLYSLTFESYIEPAYIIFTDNNGNQTENLEFENGKTYVYGDDAISSITVVDASVAAIYNIAGVQTSGYTKGINLVKYTDGTIKKVLVK